MSLVYGTLPTHPENCGRLTPEAQARLLQKAADMGFQAMLPRSELNSGDGGQSTSPTYSTLSNPEEVRFRDEKGRVKERVVSEEKTEFSRLRRWKFLFATRCLARLYALSDRRRSRRPWILPKSTGNTRTRS